MTTIPFEASLATPSPFVPQIQDGQSIKIVGLGGVGGILVRYLCLFLASLRHNVRVVLIDGDEFDPTTNTARMFFRQPGNKAAVIRDDLMPFFEGTQLSLTAIEEFVVSTNVERLIHHGDIVFLCVDNHQSRLLLNNHCARLADVSLFSGGNDGVGNDSTGVYRRGTFGNVQAYLRRDGYDVSPSLAQFHPEIAHPRDKNPSDASCVEAYEHVPQLLPANLCTASALLNTFWLTLCGALQYSEVVFDIADATMGPLPFPGPSQI